MARQCDHDRDCPQGKHCTPDGYCADTSGGGTPIYTCANDSSHCPQGQTCQGGTCVPVQTTPPPTGGGDGCPAGYYRCGDAGCIVNGTPCTPEGTGQAPQTPSAGGGGGGGGGGAAAPQESATDIGNGCFQVCGDQLIQSYRDRAAALQDQIDLEKQQMEQSQAAWGAQHMADQQRIANLTPQNVAPTAPGAPGGYVPGRYNYQPGATIPTVVTMPGGGDIPGSTGTTSAPTPTLPSSVTGAPQFQTLQKYADWFANPDNGLSSSAVTSEQNSLMDQIFGQNSGFSWQDVLRSLQQSGSR